MTPHLRVKTHSIDEILGSKRIFCFKKVSKDSFGSKIGISTEMRINPEKCKRDFKKKYSQDFFLSDYIRYR